MSYQQMIEKAMATLGQGFDYMWPKVVQYAWYDALFAVILGVVLIGLSVFAFKIARCKDEDGYSRNNSEWKFCWNFVSVISMAIGLGFIFGNLQNLLIPEVAAFKSLIKGMAGK